MTKRPLANYTDTMSPRPRPSSPHFLSTPITAPPREPLPPLTDSSVTRTRLSRADPRSQHGGWFPANLRIEWPKEGTRAGLEDLLGFISHSSVRHSRTRTRRHSGAGQQTLGDVPRSWQSPRARSVVATPEVEIYRRSDPAGPTAVYASKRRGQEFELNRHDRRGGGCTNGRRSVRGFNSKRPTQKGLVRRLF